MWKMGAKRGSVPNHHLVSDGRFGSVPPFSHILYSRFMYVIRLLHVNSEILSSKNSINCEKKLKKEKKNKNLISIIVTVNVHTFYY